MTDRSPAFPTTRWSVVIAARQAPSVDADAALEAICRIYWYPLYAFARRHCSPADAQDMTQGFFEKLLEKNWLDAVDRDKGRMRTFLITALKHYMHNEWRQARTLRRGGAVPHLPFDTELAETRFIAEAVHHDAPERTYDRDWALNLLELALNRLRAHYETANSSYEILKPCLMADRGAIDYGELATNLGTTEGAARVAVRRLRERFRQIYREEIAETLPPGADLLAEIRYLAAALAAC